MNTTSSKAWAALITALAGVAALYGVNVALPDSGTLSTLIGVLIPFATAAATWLTPNRPKV